MVVKKSVRQAAMVTVIVTSQIKAEIDQAKQSADELLELVASGWDIHSSVGGSNVVVFILTKPLEEAK